MLLDFTKLKKTLREVCGKIDHTNLNDIEFFEQNPSAERIAVYIYNHIIEEIPSLKKTDGKKAWLYAIDVFETETSRARYIAE